MWVLLAQLYWVDVLRMRRFGRRLVFALLSHLDTVGIGMFNIPISRPNTDKQMHNDPDRDILSQLFNQLFSMVTSLLKSNPESFVFPSTWHKYRDMLRSELPLEDEAARTAHLNISVRNTRLAVTGSAYNPAGRQQLVRLLDSTFQRLVDPEFASECWATCDDKIQLIRTLTEWATSGHRSGLSKVYVATSLFRAWYSEPEFDATKPVLDVIDGVGAHDSIRKNLVYHLVTELVRMEAFSIPRYLQWLIARGGCYDASDVDSDTGSCATRLLVEMPVYRFQDGWKNERSNLLRRAGNFSVIEEELDMINALKCVEQALGLPLAPDDPMYDRKPFPLRKLLSKISRSSRSLKSFLGSQMRDAIKRKILSDGVTPELFASVRSVLETCEDFAILSDVVRFCTKSADPDVLAACADTINLNLPIWLALGSAIDLFDSLIERLKHLRQQQGIAARPLLASTSLLASRLPGHEGIAQHLRQELIENDRSNAIDACSPVSDSMLPQTTEGEVSDEIDKLLANGNKIDHPTMNRLFRTIVPRLEAGWAKADDSRRVYATSLTKMRVFDARHFDKLMADWVSHIRSLESRPKLMDLFPLLVTAGCLSMATLLHTANASPPMVGKTADAANLGSATYLQELLRLILMKTPKSVPLSVEEAYQFGIHQQAAQLDDAKGMLVLVRNVILEYSALRALDTDIELALDDAAMQGNFLDLLKYLAVVESAAATETLNIKGLPAEASDFISRMTTRLLVPGDDGSAQTSFDRILSLAGELTLPFCQLKLNCDLSKTDATSGESEEQPLSRFEVFANAMDRAIEANNIMWTSMLPCLSADVSQHLKSLAQGRFLSLVPSLKSDRLHEAASLDQIHTAKNLLGVIEAITAGQPAPKSAQLSATLAEKLADTTEIIALKPEEDNVALRNAVLSHWLPALLRLITLNSYISDPTMATPLPLVPATGKPALPTGVSHEIRARIIIVLSTLLLELQVLSPSVAGDLPEQVYDVAVSLADALPDDHRQQCAKVLLFLPGTTASTNTSSDPRLCYLLSMPQPSATDNLVLVHRDRLTTGPGSRSMGAMYGYGNAVPPKLTPFLMRPWEMLSESTPNVGENDTSLSLSLFESIKIQ